MTAKLLRILATAAVLIGAPGGPALDAQEQRQPPASQTTTGAQLFRTYCASCHGPTAQGDGPMAARLRHAPPSLTNYSERNDGVFPSERVYRIIDGRDVPSHGDHEMPVWGDAFRSEPQGRTADDVKARIDAIVGYLRAIQRRDAEFRW